MRVQVEVQCWPRPRTEIEEALRLAGRQLARTPDSVSVWMDPEDPRTAFLEFEMRRSAQYKVVDHIADRVEEAVGISYQDITIRFPKG